MTCEVMLMNLDAVAFAADSAITWSGGNDAERYSEGEKAFIVDPRGPIGAVFYGDAEYCGTASWVHVARRFSEQLTDTPDTVGDACAQFRDFLLSSESELLRPGASDQMFAHYVCNAVEAFQMLHAGVWRVFGAERAASHALRLFEDMTRNVYDPRRATVTARKIIGQMTPQLNQLILDDLKPLVQQTLRRGYGGHALSGLEARLTPIIEASLLTDWLPPGVSDTGLVVAGFGKRDRTPAFVHMSIFGDIGGVLKHQQHEAMSTSPTGAPYVVRSFAMNKAVIAYLQGVHPDVRDALENHVSATMDGSFRIIADIIRDKAPALSAEIETIMLQSLYEGPHSAIRAAIREREAKIQQAIGDLATMDTPEALAKRAQALLQLVVTENEVTAGRSVAKPVSLLHMTKGRAVFSRS